MAPDSSSCSVAQGSQELGRGCCRVKTLCRGPPSSACHVTVCRHPSRVLCFGQMEFSRVSVRALCSPALVPFLPLSPSPFSSRFPRLHICVSSVAWFERQLPRQVVSGGAAWRKLPFPSFPRARSMCFLTCWRPGGGKRWVPHRTGVSPPAPWDVSAQPELSPAFTLLD